MSGAEITLVVHYLSEMLGDAHREKPGNKLGLPSIIEIERAYGNRTDSHFGIGEDIRM
jgi:hypothetical protein